MELRYFLYYINVLMSIAPCFGQLLHADVLTKFFIGNSGRNCENNGSQKVKTYDKNQHILPPVMNDYLDMLLHKSRREKVVNMRNPQQKTNLHLQSRKRKVQEDRKVHLNGSREPKILGSLFLHDNLRVGNVKLFEKPRKTQIHERNQAQDMFIKSHASKQKLKPTNLTREEELLRFILKHKGINLDSKGRTKPLLTSTSRPQITAPFNKQSKDFKLSFVKHTKQPSTKMHFSTKSLAVGISVTRKPTTMKFLPNASTTKSSNLPSQTQIYQSKFTTQHTPSSLLQSLISTAKKIQETTNISMTSSKPTELIAHSQPLYSTKQTSEIATQQQSQELTSTPRPLAVSTTQQDISNILSMIPTKLVFEVIQPKITLPVTSSPSLTMRQEIWKGTSRQARRKSPLPPVHQNIQSSLLSTSSSSTTTTKPSSSSSSSLSLTTSTVTTIRGAVRVNDVSRNSLSTSSPMLGHYDNSAQNTVTMATTHIPVKLSSTQRTNLSESYNQNTMKNHSNEHSVYQINDRSINSEKTIPEATYANLFFEKLKSTNFLNDLKNNGKEKTNKGNTTCVKECTILQNVCKNGATCLTSCSGFTCVCAEGFTGFFCDKIMKTT